MSCTFIKPGDGNVSLNVCVTIDAVPLFINNLERELAAALKSATKQGVAEPHHLLVLVNVKENEAVTRLGRMLMAEPVYSLWAGLQFTLKDEELRRLESALAECRPVRLHPPP